MATSYWGVDHGGEVSKARAPSFKLFGPPGGMVRRASPTMKMQMKGDAVPPASNKKLAPRPVREAGGNNRNASGRPRFPWSN